MWRRAPWGRGWGRSGAVAARRLADSNNTVVNRSGPPRPARCENGTPWPLRRRASPIHTAHPPPPYAGGRQHGRTQLAGMRHRCAVTSSSLQWTARYNSGNRVRARPMRARPDARGGRAGRTRRRGCTLPQSAPASAARGQRGAPARGVMVGAGGSTTFELGVNNV